MLHTVVPDCIVIPTALAFYIMLMYYLQTQFDIHNFPFIGILDLDFHIYTIM